MFLNNLTIYSFSLVGIIFLIISLTFSKTISLFTYELSSKEKQRQSVNNHINNCQNSHISIQVNPFSQLNEQSTRLSLDDDEELIKSDLSSISNFCENNSIELRLDQDPEYDN